MWLGGVIWPGPFDISAAVEIPRQNRELNQSRNEHDGLRTGDRLCRARAAAGGVAVSVADAAGSTARGHGKAWTGASNGSYAA